jgi:hypothetical protein
VTLLEDESSSFADVPLSSPQATRAMVRRIASRRFPVIPIKRGQAPGMTTRERSKTAPDFLILYSFPSIYPIILEIYY